MKSTMRACLVLGVVFGFVSIAGAACSNSSLSGPYGFVITGTDSSNGAVAIVGEFTATPGSPKGSLTGSETFADTAGIAPVGFTGTYQVTANCSGQATLSIQGSKKPTTVSFVVVSGGQAIDIVDTGAGEVQSGVGFAQGSAVCTNAGVKGSFSFLNTGTVIGTGGIAFDGRLTFNGSTGVTGTETGSEAGTILTGVPLSGTYAIKSNCSGTGTLTPQGGVATNFNFVVVSSGATILAIETDANTIVTGILQH